MDDWQWCFCKKISSDVFAPRSRNVKEVSCLLSTRTIISCGNWMSIVQIRSTLKSIRGESIRYYCIRWKLTPSIAFSCMLEMGFNAFASAKDTKLFGIDAPKREEKQQSSPLYSLNNCAGPTPQEIPFSNSPILLHIHYIWISGDTRSNDINAEKRLSSQRAWRQYVSRMSPQEFVGLENYGPVDGFAFCLLTEMSLGSRWDGGEMARLKEMRGGGPDPSLLNWWGCILEEAAWSVTTSCSCLAVDKSLLSNSIFQNQIWKWLGWLPWTFL